MLFYWTGAAWLYRGGVVDIIDGPTRGTCRVLYSGLEWEGPEANQVYTTGDDRFYAINRPSSTWTIVQPD